MTARRPGLGERLRAFRGDLAEDPRAPRSGMRRLTWLAMHWLLLGWWLLADRLPRAPRRAAAALSTARSEVRTSVRGLFRRPGLAITVIVTLGAGTGSSIAAYGLLYEVLLRPLPYSDPERLVAVWPELWASKQHYDLLRGRGRSFTAVAAYTGGGAVLSGDGDPTLLFGPEVTPEFFELLGLRLHLGRGIRAGDEAPGAEPVVVLAHGFWSTRFGADERVLGRTLQLDGAATRVVGVLRPDADLIQAHAEIVRPLPIDPAAPGYSSARYLRLYGRLAPGVTEAQARSELQSIARTWEHAGLSERLIEMATTPRMLEERVSNQRPLLRLLAGAVALLLAIACVNVAGLLLGRHLERRHELAVRRALGAGAVNLFFHVLVEAAALAAAGTLAGLAAASWALGALQPVLVAHVGMTRLSGSVWHADVVIFAVGVMTVVTLLAGGLPAIGVIRNVPASAMTGGTRSTLSRRTIRSADIMVVAQVAIATVLLVAASLTIRSLAAMSRIDVGFEPSSRFVFWLSPNPQLALDGAALENYFVRMTETLREVPGIIDARAVHIPPVRGGGWVGGVFAEGAEPEKPDDMSRSFYRIVEPGYLEAIRARLLRGRFLDASDVRGATDAVVVNDRLARALWGDGDPVGRRLRSMMKVAEWSTVVGVVADMRHMDPRADPVPTLYGSLSQWADLLVDDGFRTLAVVVHSDESAGAAIDAARRAVWSVDPVVPVIDPEFLERSLADRLTEPRLVSGTLLGFAAAALGLAALGLYGSISRSVRRRTRELGIRQAIGARPRDLVVQAVRRSLGLVAVGLVVGGGTYLVARPLLRSFLYGVGETDPPTLAAAIATLLVVALLASLVPARRAARISPTAALRAE